VKRYKEFNDEGLTFTKKVLLLSFVLFYPLFVSMYTMLPPLIGIAGYSLVTNIDKNKFYMFSALFYLLNLDFNLTLPIFLSTLISVLIYILFYARLTLLIRCRVCLLFALIVLIDFSYYVSLFIYDFMFASSTVLGDMLLIYYIVVDIFIGVLL
jgi:hypothetical protein